MKRWGVLLLAGLGLALIQQQLLQRRPPRLKHLEAATPPPTPHNKAASHVLNMIDIQGEGEARRRT